MDTKSKFEHLLSHWFKSIDAPALTLDETGICAFHYKDEMLVALEMPDDSALAFVYSGVMEVPAMDKQAFYEAALALNSYGIATKGATLALDKQKGLLFLYQTLRVESLDDTAFGNVMANFLESVGEVREELTELIGSKDGDEPLMTGNPMMGGGFISG